MTTELALIVEPKNLDAIHAALANDPRLVSGHSRRSYEHDLAQFETWRQARPISKLLVESYAAELRNAGKSPNTINRALASIRWWARKVADIAVEDLTLGREARQDMAEQALRVANVADVKGSRAPKGREITAGELSELMRACANDDTPAGVRDSALISLAWATGERVSEIAGLQLADLAAGGECEYDLTIRHGKGDKARQAYIYNGAGAALADWLAVRGGEPGPVFVAINKAGKLQPLGALTSDGLQRILDKRAGQAGLTAPISWHDFRRTFAGNLLDSGVDLVTVQKLLGHSSPVTTSNYDRRGEEVKRKPIKTLHVPYHRKDKATK
jgi:site-specific recombinase XerD